MDFSGFECGFTLKRVRGMIRTCNQTKICIATSLVEDGTRMCGIFIILTIGIFIILTIP